MGNIHLVFQLVSDANGFRGFFLPALRGDELRRIFTDMLVENDVPLFSNGLVKTIPPRYSVEFLNKKSTIASSVSKPTSVIEME